MRSCHRDHRTCREPILRSPYRRSPLPIQILHRNRRICRRARHLRARQRRSRQPQGLAILPIRSGRRLLPLRTFLLSLSKLLRRIFEVSQLAQEILGEVGPTVAEVYVIGVLPDIERQ